MPVSLSVPSPLPGGEAASGVSSLLYTEGDKHICRINGLWWHSSDPEKVADILRGNRAGWQTRCLKYLNPGPALADLQQCSVQKETRINQFAPSPPKLSRRGNLIWILCQLISAGQYLLHVQCIGNDTTHGFGFQDGREIFHGYYLTLVPVSRRVKASELQWWSWELQWMCMRNILWRGFLRCVEVWSWKRKYYCLNCSGEWKRKVRQGDGRSGEFPRWVHCLRKYPALICLGVDFPADLFDSP